METKLICKLYLVPLVCSVVQVCPTLCDPVDCTTLGFPVLHHLPEFAQTHVHELMPSNHLVFYHPLLLLSSTFPSISLFQRVGSSHQVAKGLELQLQCQFFQ